MASCAGRITDGIAEFCTSVCALCVCTYIYCDYNVIFVCMRSYYHNGVSLSLFLQPRPLVIENDGDSIKQ